MLKLEIFPSRLATTIGTADRSTGIDHTAPLQ
jgi:hypothetical protein